MNASAGLEQLHSVLDERRAETALVRGERAPPRPPATVTVAPGVAASLRATGRRAPIRVTAEARCGRTVRRYDGAAMGSVADRAAALAADRDAAAVWLCDRERVAAWWSERAARRLERRLAAALGETDAPLVVWTAERTEAVGDRYDLVLDP